MIALKVLLSKLSITCDFWHHFPCFFFPLKNLGFKAVHLGYPSTAELYSWYHFVIGADWRLGCGKE
uniref:Uncharacterized protein n=1 Tax=Anguilla anguilla TaxID=7936 RepID=A0A0E9RIU4_ANGAN